MFVPKMKFVGSVEFEIWTFVWRKLKSQAHTQSHTQTDTQTNCSKNIIPPRFCGGVTNWDYLSRTCTFFVRFNTQATILV